MGDSVMSAAVHNGVSSIIGECGGAMACATCHVYLDPDTNALFDPRSPGEEDMLEMAAAEVTAGSRLSCQLLISEDTPDFSVRVPDVQV